jgi:hypothetical protein
MTRYNEEARRRALISFVCVSLLFFLLWMSK